MTRPFNQKVHCPNCRSWINAETFFGSWLRNNKRLDSIDGTCVLDSDYWIHRFKTYSDPNGKYDRQIQCIMLVEVKTNGCNLSEAQRDTLYMVNQLLRNRSKTPTKNPIYQSGISIAKVKSTMQDTDVVAWCYGVHVLRFSGLGPQDSEHIWWDDKKEITEDQLTDLLNFDINPDTLLPMDFRIHHYKESQLALFSVSSIIRNRKMKRANLIP